MDLKCRKLDCKHNKEYACMCKEIHITGSCDCKTYEKADKLDKNQKQDASKNMFEVAPEVHPYRHNKSVDIKCDANCLFNENCRCRANGICVNEEDSAPTCITFIEE